MRKSETFHDCFLGFLWLRLHYRQARSACHRKRDSIQAHLTIVLAALPISLPLAELAADAPIMAEAAEESPSAGGLRIGCPA